MKIRKILLSATFLCSSSLLFAQVQIDKPIQLTGGSGERVITNLEAPVNPSDAANKAYVDAAVAAAGSPKYTMLSEESSTSMNLRSALDYCHNLTESTYSDWKLPTLGEMMNILSTGGTTIPNSSSPSFFYFQPDNPASSTQLALMRLSDGYITTISTTTTSYTYNVRCIR